jgi:hypothetical protein
MVVSGKKEQIETIINRMPSTPILIMLLKTIKTFTNEAKIGVLIYLVFKWSGLWRLR